MSKFTEGAKKERISYGSASARVAVGVTHDVAHGSIPLKNYMNSTSFKPDPVAALKLMAASSIFGEPKYYEGRTKSADKFEAAIDAALHFDFKAVLDFAAELRSTYFMRLNPQIIVVRAACHPKREAFTATHPGYFTYIMKEVALRPDDITTQIEYYLACFDSRKGAQSTNKKARMPNVLKRAQEQVLAQFGTYHIAKYQEKGIGLVNVVRLLNTRYLRTVNATIDELMKKGKVQTSAEQKTWRTLKSAGMKWPEILHSGITLSHSDYLFQLRTILSELDSEDFTSASKVIEGFLRGVEKGKMFPYQYWIAYRTLENQTFNHKTRALDALNKAITLAVYAQPKLAGRVATLVDNSGSARAGITFEGANTHVYEIGNLSGIMTALNADEGVVGVFGDGLKMVPVKQSASVMDQLKEVNRVGETVGQGTEHGIWLFWRDAIANKTHYDHVFIYSDMQAGTGGLYGINSAEYSNFIYGGKRGYGHEYIDVWKLIEEYRKLVNPRVNVFSIQVAGYDNSVLPENKYRGANLTGWTGKEVTFAQAIINLWNQLEQ
jgi:60 kDa SS-A/Ro ribonucleoprotein